MKQSKNKRTPKTLQDLYEDFQVIYILYKIEQEALSFCYEEEKDYGHIFSLDVIFADKFEKALKDFQQIINLEN